MDTNSNTLRSLLRRVARELRYRTVEEMVGKTVRINSLDDVVPDTLRFVNRCFPGCRYAGPRRNSLHTAFAKYGLLDLEFHMPSFPLDADAQSGIPLLKDLGFVSRDRDPSDDCPEVLEWCLESLLEGINKNRILLKLFMRPASRKALHYFQHRVRDLFDLANQKKISPGECANRLATMLTDPLWLDFPAKFKINDACVTNSDHVWVSRHFYL